MDLEAVDLETIKSITIVPDGLCLTSKLSEVPSVVLSSEQLCVVLFNELRVVQDYLELLGNQVNHYDP